MAFREITWKIRAFNFFVALDQMLWSILSLGAGWPDETLSSASWRHEQYGSGWAQWARPLIDAIWFWEPNHCEIAYQAEILRSQAPEPLTAIEAHRIVKAHIRKVST